MVPTGYTLDKNMLQAMDNSYIYIILYVQFGRKPGTGFTQKSAVYVLNLAICKGITARAGIILIALYQ